MPKNIYLNSTQELINYITEEDLDVEIQKIRDAQ